MDFSKRRISPYDHKVTPVELSSKDYVTSEFLEPSPVDEFMFSEMESEGQKSIRLTSDICMLFNQRRLDRLSRAKLIDYFNDLSISNSTMSDLRAKLGDDQLITFVKSRFIQSPSELMAWSQYLMSSSDAVVAELATAQQQEQPASQQSEQPAPAE